MSNCVANVTGDEKREINMLLSFKNKLKIKVKPHAMLVNTQKMCTCQCFFL